MKTFKNFSLNFNINEILKNKFSPTKGACGKYSIDLNDNSLTSYIYRSESDRDSDYQKLINLLNY
jgi:hypothetical protein